MDTSRGDASLIVQFVKNLPAMEETPVWFLGRSAGEGISYPLQYSWASLVAQLVKNPPAMQETWVRSLGWEDPLEKGKATHSSILAWRIPWTMGSPTVRHDWATFTLIGNKDRDLQTNKSLNVLKICDSCVKSHWVYFPFWDCNYSAIY